MDDALEVILSLHFLLHTDVTLGDEEQVDRIERRTHLEVRVIESGRQMCINVPVSTLCRGERELSLRGKEKK